MRSATNANILPGWSRQRSPKLSVDGLHNKGCHLRQVLHNPHNSTTLRELISPLPSTLLLPCPGKAFREDQMILHLPILQLRVRGSSHLRHPQSDPQCNHSQCLQPSLQHRRQPSLLFRSTMVTPLHVRHQDALTNACLLCVAAVSVNPAALEGTWAVHMINTVTKTSGLFKQIQHPHLSAITSGSLCSHILCHLHRFACLGLPILQKVLQRSTRSR
jgi:hypothetical protein